MTAEQYFKEHLSGEPLTQESVIEGLKEFAKFHVQAQQKAILENVSTIYECGNKSKENCDAMFCRNCTEVIDKQSIINTYPLNLIQ